MNRNIDGSIKWYPVSKRKSSLDKFKCGSILYLAANVRQVLCFVASMLGSHVLKNNLRTAQCCKACIAISEGSRRPFVDTPFQTIRLTMYPRRVQERSRNWNKEKKSEWGYSKIRWSAHIRIQHTWKAHFTRRHWRCVQFTARGMKMFLAAYVRSQNNLQYHRN